MRIVRNAACVVSCAALLWPAAEARAMSGPLDLVWVDPTGAAPGAYGWARDESTAILREAGVSVRWRQAAPSEMLEAGEVAVVVMQGSAVRSRPGHLVLGASQTGTDAVSAVWIYAREVAQALGLRGDLGMARSGQERFAFGTALGRVAAHEVIHALLPQHPHASGGLMGERVDMKVLAGKRPRLDAATRAALLLRGVAAPDHASAQEPSAGSDETVSSGSSSIDETR